MSNQPLSPQGYNLGRAPKNTNPFFDILRRGVTATVAIGRVIVNTLAPESDATASVENSGTATDGVFDFTFGIPAGKDGKDGTDGLNASIRAVNSAVVEDVPYGGTPFCFVQNLGTEQDANFKFTFGIPAGKDGKDGKDGTDGEDGAPGAPGADGVGVPPGGTAGQVLAKKTNADYDTEWVNQSGGGGGGDTVSVDQVLTSGTEIGGVTVNGTRTALYAPQGGGGGGGAEYAYGTYTLDDTTNFQATSPSYSTFKIPLTNPGFDSYSLQIIAGNVSLVTLTALTAGRYPNVLSLSPGKMKTSFVWPVFVSEQQGMEFVGWADTSYDFMTGNNKVNLQFFENVPSGAHLIIYESGSEFLY